MHNPASVLEDDTHKLLWDFDTQTDHLISATRPDNIIIHKKDNLQNRGLCCPSWPQNKSEWMWKGLVPELNGELKKKTVEHEGDDYTNHDLCFWYSQ